MLDNKNKKPNSALTVFERIFSLSVKIGNNIIIFFAVFVYGFKEIICLITRKKNNQTLIEYTDKIRKHLEESQHNTASVNSSRPYSPNNTSYKTPLAVIRRRKRFSKKNIIYVLGGTGIVLISMTIGLIAFGAQKEDDNISTPPQEEQMQTAILREMPDLCLLKEEYLTPRLSEVSYENFNKFMEISASRAELGNDEPTDNTNGEPPQNQSGELDPNILIHLGDTNDEVAKLQEYLMTLHYMDEDEPTTYYGVVTEFAMQLFQRGHGLQVDGIAGAETLSLLYSDEAKPYMVRKGDKGTDITMIQKRLVELGYLNSSDKNGKFDDDTDMAIRVFQGRNKLSQDGIVGYYTTQVLFNGDAKPAHTSSSPGGDNGGSTSEGPTNYTYSADDGENLVAFAKSLLNQGIPYVWGGKTLSGLDCSGYVYYCLNHSGYSIRYMTSEAWAKSSYQSISSMNDLKPGDILCFDGHVAIYIGNGQMIDSSSSQNGIRIASFKTSTYWNKKWICGKRVFP